MPQKPLSMVKAFFERDGYAVVDGVLSPGLIGRLIDAIDSARHVARRREKNHRV